jgi:hypothetical protein
MYVQNLGTGLQIQWPDTFKTFILSFDVLNFNSLLVNVSSADCVSSVTYYIKFLVIVMCPVVILLVLGVVYGLPRYFQIGCFRYAHPTQRQRDGVHFWRLFVYSLFLIYPGVSSTVLRHYVCMSIEGESFLQTDMRVRCFTPIWEQFAFGAVPLIILYPVPHHPLPAPPLPPPSPLSPARVMG